MNKSKMNDFEQGKHILEKKTEQRKRQRMKQMKKKRLIIRNLSFKVTEEELTSIFSKFGEVLDVRIPVNSAGRKRGFAFLQFKNTKAQIRAMKELNFKEIKGRPIAIDFAIDKDTYQSRQNNIKSESKIKDESDIKTEVIDEEYEMQTKFHTETIDSEDEVETKIHIKSKDAKFHSRPKSDEDKKFNADDFLKEFGAGEDDENSENDTSSDSSEDTDDEHESHADTEQDSEEEEEEEEDIKKKSFQKRGSDISEGKTVFIRNILFQSIEEDLHQIVQEYGETDYCLFCIDSITGHFRGTAFVKFKLKEGADKLIEESYKEPGIMLDGRRLSCTQAVSREELPKKDDGDEKKKDKRNLRLLKCGLVAYGYKEAEGVSQTDMAKRAQLEMVKKQKLRNVNFFVSDTRLACHNLPKNITDKDLHALVKKAAGKGAVVKEARVMCDFKKTDAQGNPVSRGFGFVAFTQHEHALKALMELNNNPKVFVPHKRPIVEFSVENKVALLSQEKKKERMKLMHKRNMEKKNSSQDMEPSSELQFRSAKNEKSSKKQKKNDKGKMIRKVAEKEKKVTDKKISSTSETTSPKKQKKKRNRKGKKNRGQDTQSREDISFLTLKYKEKLLNKMS